MRKVLMLGRFRNTHGPIGLDVGGEGVRMLQLCRSAGRLRVAAAARWRFPDPALGRQSDPDARNRLAGEAVTGLLRDHAFRGRDAVSCLRCVDLNVKNVRLPRMPESDLARAVQWECKDRFGFEVSPDRMHYVNAGEVRQGNEVQDEVILLAVTEETISRHLDMLARMRLRPAHIDTEPTALLRTYGRHLRRSQDEAVVSVIADIGYAATKVVVARGATILLVKSVDLGGQNFDESVARQLNLDRQEASHLRKQGARDGRREPPDSAPDPGDPVRWTVRDAIREPAEALAREISLCLRYCSVTFRGLRPSQITLAGGETYDPILVGLLKENLDCPCVLGEPLRGVDLGGSDLGGDRRGQLMEWSVATGLALRDFCGDGRQEKQEKAACHERG